MPEIRPDALLDRIAQPQQGLVERLQAHGRGITEQNLRSRLAKGALRRVGAGVYATMGSRLTWEQKVLTACLEAGPQALASHRTAAALWGLIDRPVPLDLVVPYARCPTPAGVHVHRSTDLRAIDAARHRGIPVTNPIRTVGDLGAVAPHLVAGAIETGLYRNLFGLAGLWQLIDDLAKPGRRGLGVLRRVLEQRALGDRRTRSPLEPLLAALAVGIGLRLEYQHRVVIDGHTYFLDFALPEVMLAIEVDGLEIHATRDALDGDLERQNRLIVAGWYVLRYTVTHLVKRREAVRREVLRLVEQRRSAAAAVAAGVTAAAVFEDPPLGFNGRSSKKR
jgi:very-short-patch-repair endonuclease